MPVAPAELTARFKIEGPDEALAAAREAAAPSGLVRDAGPQRARDRRRRTTRCWRRSATR